jgi:cytochrome c peroxidase
VGEGGNGLGVTRDTGHGEDAIPGRVPRNAPHLFNLGAREFRRMFHDGRVESDVWHPSGFRSPAGDQLPPGLHNPLAAQAMMPVTSGTEMAGQPGENEIADAAAAGRFSGEDGVWGLLAKRLRAIPEYVERFHAVYPAIRTPEQITFVDAANAIAAYEAVTGRSDNSPFDRYLRGDRRAMSPAAVSGMTLFYSKANCSTCHSGIFQTDHDFHSIAMPQLGPGKGDGSDGHDDFGREQVSGNPADRYRFRTPTLRNVALTAPYGHDGAYDSLTAVIVHHLYPGLATRYYNRTQVTLPSRPDLDAGDFVVHDDPARRAAIVRSHELPHTRLSLGQLGDIVEFLRALTDPTRVDLRKDTPARVPSGLPLYD